MKKKGYTLIEVIVSIMILSIASLMLAGAFGRIMHFMSKSNDVKNASDLVNASIESNQFNLSKLKKNQVNKQYKILGDKSTITVDGSVSTYAVKNEDDIRLRIFTNDKLIPLKDYDGTYKNLMSLTKDVIMKWDQAIATQDPFIKEAFPTNFFIKSLFLDVFKNTWNIFPNMILPLDIQPTNADMKYYGRISFPWDTYDENFNNIPGGMLYYLTLENTDYPSDSENIQIFYDYTEGNWYYYPDNKVFTDYRMVGKTSEAKVQYLNQEEFQNYDEFLKHVKESKNDKGESAWLKLDPDAGFDGQDTSNIWKHF